MSAYKQFTTKDVTVTPFDPDKRFTLSGSQLIESSIGIEIYSGVKPPLNSSVSPSSIPTGIVHIENTTGIYNSIKHLYYSNYLSSSKGDLATTQSIVPGVNPEDDRFVGKINAPRYDNYLQSTLTQSRHFPTNVGDEITVVSIPSKIFGNNIIPQSFEFTYSSSLSSYLVKDDGEGNLIIADIKENLIPITPQYGDGTYGISRYEGFSSPSGYGIGTYGVSSYDEVTPPSGYGTGTYGTSNYGTPPPSNTTGSIGNVVGQIFYSHGIATFTTGAFASIGSQIDQDNLYINNIKISYLSSVRIYENQYKCRILENEYGYSQNPSILSGSFDDVYYNFATGSEFTPYVTTVGLYNEVNELIVVGKLSMPVPVSQFVDTTIIVNFDT